MKQVAELAGVSIKTVSRVLNGQPGAGPEVAGRVRAAAESLGYRPDLSASNLRRSDRRSATLGVLLEDLSNPFDAALLRAVEDRAHDSGVLVLAGSNERDPVRQRELLDALAGRRVDGMVVMALPGHQDVLHRERERGLPMVLVDRPALFEHTDSVTTTNRASSCEAVLDLVRRGHRRIGFLGTRQALWTGQERHAGYVEGLAGSDLPLEDALVRTGLQGPEVAERAAGDLLDGPRPPTALLAAQNQLTIGVVRALRTRALQHRVALVGFDDFPLADLVEPAVTVIRQDLRTIGRTAADLVFRRIDGDGSPAVHVVVEAELVRRGSGEIPPPG